MTSADSTARPLRADAERNRQRILKAAGALFAERGVSVSLDEVAAAAGVGIGTVYRRFPDREALIGALLEDKLARIGQLGQEALAIEDPGQAFVAFFSGMARMQARDRGLKEVLLSTDRGRERLATLRSAIRPVACELMQRAKDAGVLREDLDVQDLPMLHAAISSVADTTRCVAPEYFERVLAIVIDGLLCGRTPLPAPAMDLEQLTAAMRSRRA